MTAPPAAERSIPAPANQALAGREAVRSSLANSSAPGCRDAAFAPQHPLPLGARDPWVEGEEEGTGTLGFPDFRCVGRPSSSARFSLTVDYVWQSGVQSPTPYLWPREGNRLAQGHTVAGRVLGLGSFPSSPLPFFAPLPSLLLQLWYWGNFSTACSLSRRNLAHDLHSSLPRVWCGLGEGPGP